MPAPELEKLIVDETLKALKADVRTRTLVMKLAGYGEIAAASGLKYAVNLQRVGVPKSHGTRT